MPWKAFDAKDVKGTRSQCLKAYVCYGMCVCLSIVATNGGEACYLRLFGAWRVLGIASVFGHVGGFERVIGGIKRKFFWGRGSDGRVGGERFEVGGDFDLGGGAKGLGGERERALGYVLTLNDGGRRGEAGGAV